MPAAGSNDPHPSSRGGRAPAPGSPTSAGSLERPSGTSLVRIVRIIATVFQESRIAPRAAALSFSSLLGLGPLIAIAVLVSGFAIGQQDPAHLAEALNRIIQSVAPYVAQYEQANQASPQVTPGLVDVIQHIIEASRSGSAGAFGLVTLLFIVLLLFKSIEDTFNDIWGVRQGRSVLVRVVLYWTILSLGAILFFGAVAMLGAGTFVNVFMEKLPGGAGLLRALALALPAVSVGLLTLLLTLCYRVIPNTRVQWRAALIGALVVAALLLGNNLVAFLYLKRVYLERSLYGSLALPLVLMTGLYIFWLCVLTGGIVSYAIQNAHQRTGQTAWHTLSAGARERLSLVVFLAICRRFDQSLPPLPASTLGTSLRIPAQLLNECLNRLVRLQLVSRVGTHQGGTGLDDVYQPASPLHRLTLERFHQLHEGLGEDPLATGGDLADPILAQFNAALARTAGEEFLRIDIAELLRRHPAAGSGPESSRTA